MNNNVRSSFATSTGALIDSLYIPLLVRGTAVVITLFIIPLEFILRNILGEHEGELIHTIQRTRSTDLDDFFKAVVYSGSHNIMIALLPAFFNIVDPVISAKINIVSCNTLYLYSLTAIFFTEPRPYWIHTDIKGINCENGYGAPCEEVLFSMVFYLYVIIEMFERSQKKVRVILYIVASLWICLIGFAELYLGENFPHQIFFTICLGFIYLTIALTNDFYLSKLALISSFYNNKNRKSKIYWFVASMSMLLIILTANTNIYTNSNIDLIWIKNAYKECKFSNDISGDYSFNQSSWMFYNLGAVFGAMETSKRLPLGWWRTSVWKKVIRCIISSLVSFGIYYGFNSITTYDNATKYTFNYALNVFICAYISFGALPLIFNKMKLNSELDVTMSFASGISLHGINE